MTLDSHRSMNPTMNCTCEGSRLWAPYENLMPDDLRESWSNDTSAGEWLQIKIIISIEVWLHRDHNKLFADSQQNPINEWQVTIKLHLVWGFMVTSWCTSIVQLHLVAGFKSEPDTYFSPQVACPLFSLSFSSVPLYCTACLSQSQFW